MDAGTIGELLRTGATESPGQAAIVDVDGNLTSYAELAAEADAIAAAVMGSGVTSERAVAVVLANGPGMASAFLGVSAVAVCAPLNPAYTEAEFEFFYDDLDVAALVTDGCSEAALAVAARRALPVLRGPFPAGPAPAPRSPSDVALVLHTSGTTARPKQVPLTHANLVTSAANVARTLRLEPGDRVLNVMPLFHIHGIVAALLASLRAGASVICTPGFDASRFLATAVDRGATWYTAVPTMHQAVLGAGRRDPELAARCGFRFIRSSSAALPPLVLRDLEAMFDAPVIEAYGMTEASHQMASNPLPPAHHKPGSVGVSAGSEIAIMAPDGELLPPGATGEIVIRGPAVTRGYVGNDDANAVAFAHGWFHTGDEGVLDDEGYLTITGRLKEMINRAGEKISPREVEEVLLAHPDVAQAVVFAVPHPTMGEDVAAAVIAADGLELDVDELRRFAGVQLSQHKVPQRILVRDELPLGATGKLQRIGMAERLGLLDAIPSPPAARGGSPASPLEAAVAAVWAGVLEVDRVELDDLFVELGGDSLLAVALVAQVIDTFAVDIPVTAPLVEARTARAMAALITERRDDPKAERTPDDEPPAAVDDGVLTLAQEGMWFLEALEPTSSALHVPMALRLRGAVDAPALEKSLRALVARHETLRTRFVAGPSGLPRAVIDPASEIAVALTIDDRPEIDATERDDVAREIVEADARERFDLTVAPLLRARLVRFAADDFVLGLVVHHLVADGWARGTIRTELAALYRAEVTGGEPELATVAGRFAEFASRERHRIASGALDHELAYWTDVLTPLPQPVALAADRRVAIDPSSNVIRAELSTDAVTALTALAREHDATLFMVLLAGYVATLHRHTGSNDIVVGVPLAGRTDLRSQGVIGSFVKVLPIRVAVESDLSFTDLLERVRRACLDAYNRQAVPLEWLIQQLRPERSPHHRPLVQVAFQLRNLPSADMAMGSVLVDEIDVHPGGTQYDLAVDAVEHDGIVNLTIAYPTARFDHDTIDYFASHLLQALAAAGRDARQAVGALPLLSDAERAAVLAFGTGPPIAPADRPVHELVSTIAAEMPDAIAVQMAHDLQDVVTYAGFERRANRLAQYLVRSGIAPGDLVALCLPRTTDLLVAIFAVFKSGAAFVPLDATHPADRVAMVLDDAKASALVTTETLVHRVPSPPPNVIVLDRDQPEIDGLPAEAPLVASSVHDLAYVMFTSGSTGRPKGVEVEHRQLATYLTAFQLDVQLSPTATVLASTSVTFDAFIDELLLPLTIGASVVLANDLLRLDMQALARLLDDEVATVASGTPTVLRHLLDAGWKPGTSTALLGGEPVAPALASALLDTCSLVWNQYGPTETTDAVAAHLITRDDVAAGIIPIGHPIAGQVLRVVESSGQLAGVGIVGELFIGGLGVARGYRNRPELTATAFVDVNTDGAARRMYRSGDRCRWRADGVLEYLGRADNQVKVRGVRIELGEVEAALSAHALVTTAVADVRDGHIVAWVTGADGLAVDELLQFAGATLPRSTMPSALAIVDHVPMSSSGKVDRRALPDPPAVGGDEGALPEGPLEIAMARLWSDFLGLDGEVYRESDFFLLGGDSLMTVQLIAEIERRFLCSVPLQQILESSTLAGMTAAVDALRQQIEIAPRADPLVLLRSGRGSGTLFWVPGAGGSPISWKVVADALDDDSDVYCFEAARHRGMPDPTSMADMAAGYVDALLAKNPGRFAVGGVSFGTHIAQEMACRLEELGRPPDALILVDPRFAKSNRARRLYWRVERLVRYGRTKKPEPGRRRLPRPPAFAHMVKLSRQLRNGHTPRCYSGAALVISCREDRVTHGRDLGVRRLVAGDVRIVRTPGEHRNKMIGERLSVTASAINGVLAQLSSERVG